MKSLHKAHILKLQDKHEYERQELAKKQRKELEELLDNLEVCRDVT